MDQKIVKEEMLAEFVEQFRESIGRVSLAKGEILNQVSSHNIYSSSS